MKSSTFYWKKYVSNYSSVDSIINISFHLAYDMYAWNVSSFGMSIKENFPYLRQICVLYESTLYGEKSLFGWLQLLLPTMHFVIKKKFQLSDIWISIFISYIDFIFNNCGYFSVWFDWLKAFPTLDVPWKLQDFINTLLKMNR